MSTDDEKRVTIDMMTGEVVDAPTFAVVVSYATSRGSLDADVERCAGRAADSARTAGDRQLVFECTRAAEMALLAKKLSATLDGETFTVTQEAG